MKSFRLLTCLLGTVISLCGVMASAHALPPDPLSEFAHRTWHVQDGLPDQIVQAVAQTPDHYLWVGTTKGLLRFDGKTFLPMTHPALRHGVTCLTVAGDGSLYIGTEGGGLLHLAHGVWQLQNEKNGIQNSLIRTVYQEATSGAIWVGTDHGIYRSTGANYERMEPTVRYPNLGSTAIVQDRTGAVWSGGSYLVRFRNGSMDIFTLPEQNGSMRIKALCEGRDGSIWVGTNAGLFHQEIGDGFVKIHEVTGSVRTLSVSPEGRIWAGTAGDGLYVQNEQGFDHLRAPRVLPSNTVLSYFRDRDGNIWLGTQAGLLRLSRMGMRLTSLQDAPDSDFGTLMRDGDGSIWICSSQLFRLQGGQTERVHFAGLDGVTVRTMLRERDGALWVGTSGRGAYRFEKSGRVEHFTSEIGTNYIRGFLQSEDGSVWIATDGGIARYHAGIIDNLHEAPSAPHTLILTLAEAADHSIWIGTQRGIWVFRNGAFEQPSVASSLGDQAVWSILAEPKGALWLGTDSGLYQLHEGRFTHVLLSSDSRAPAVYQVLRTRNDTFWVAGPTRVYRLEGHDLRNAAQSQPSEVSSLETYPVSAEIPRAEIYGGMTSTGVPEPDGTAWFATSQGPLHIIPNERSAVSDVPLTIDAVRVDGQPVDWSKDLHLAAGTRTVQVDFAPILLSSQSDLRFQYKMEGFDDWTVPSQSRSAVYTNLPAGKYKLLVRALSGSAGVIATLELPITQRTHFYQTLGFYALCVIVLGVIVWGLYRARLHRMSKELNAIYAERNRLAREMHDTVIQGCTAVSALLEAHDSTQPGPKPLLDSAREHIRTTISEARDAIWNLRHEGESPALATNLRGLLEKCAISSNVKTSFQVAGDDPAVDAMTAHEILMSTREALTNAAVHSSATNIELSLACSQNVVTVTIGDDGCGFDPEQLSDNKENHYGLQGMRERIEGLGGRFSLHTVRGQGTRLRFEIPRGRVSKPKDLEVHA